MRTFLNVPFADKDKVKSLGAKWSPGHKSWYIEDLEDVEPFMPWMPKHLTEPISPKKKK